DLVDVRDGYALIARRLLGGVVVGRDVTRDGVYRASGIVRAGSDPRTALDARRAELRTQVDALEPDAAGAAEAARLVQVAHARLADLRSEASGAPRSDEVNRSLDAARVAEDRAAQQVGDLERVAVAAEERATELALELDVLLREVAQQRAVTEQRRLDRARWHERIDSLRRQHSLVEEDVARLTNASEERRHHLVEADRAAATALEALPELRAGAEAAG